MIIRFLQVQALNHYEYHYDLLCLLIQFNTICWKLFEISCKNYISFIREITTR